MHACVHGSHTCAAAGWEPFEEQGAEALPHAQMRGGHLHHPSLHHLVFIITITIVIIAQRMGARPTALQLDKSLHNLVPPSPPFLAQREPPTLNPARLVDNMQYCDIPLLDTF